MTWDWEPWRESEKREDWVGKVLDNKAMLRSFLQTNGESLNQSSLSEET